MPLSKQSRKSFPPGAVITIGSPDLVIAFRDFASARDRKPDVSKVALLAIAILSGFTSSFPSMGPLSGDEVRGLYLGILSILSIMAALDLIVFSVRCWLQKDNACEYDPDRKVEALLKKSR